jgi:hypothetical protein
VVRPTAAGAAASICVALMVYVAGLAVAGFLGGELEILRRRARRPANVTADALGRS